MARKTAQPRLEQMIDTLRTQGFEVEASGAGQFRVQKYGVAAVLAENPDHATVFAQKPGAFLGGEIARLLDRGFQKFLKTSKLEITATADHLRSIHQFTEELKEVTGAISLYNESLGTVSDRYLYDRLKGRE